jgi:tRNA-intron endonuclease, archaea type
MIQARFVGDSIISVSSDAFSLYESSRFGEKKGNKVEYSGIEVLYLVSCAKMQVFSANKEVGEENLLKKLKKKDSKVETKLIVFSDLRKKGYIVKTALKFGAEFRVYEKGVKPGEDHAKWILYTVKEHDKLDWHDFAAKNRVAHSAKKNLLIGLVDEESDVTYYEIEWTRP